MAAKTSTAMHTRRMLALLSYLKQGETLLLADLAAAVGASEAETAAGMTWFFRTMRMKLPNRNALMAKPFRATGCITACCSLRAKRCPSHWATW